MLYSKLNCSLHNFGWHYDAKHNLKRLCTCNLVSVDTLRSLQSTFLVDFDAVHIYRKDILSVASRQDINSIGRQFSLWYFILQRLADESSSSKTFTPYNKRFAAIWAGRWLSQHLFYYLALVSARRYIFNLWIKHWQYCNHCALVLGWQFSNAQTDSKPRTLYGINFHSWFCGLLC